MAMLSRNRLLGLFILSISTPTAFPQNTLDLAEADARDAAYSLISQVEKHFECDLDEESMRRLGDERFIVRVTASGEDCDDAMTYLVTLADQTDELVFRRGDDPNQPQEPVPFFPNNALILEVNPELDDEDSENQDLLRELEETYSELVRRSAEPYVHGHPRYSGLAGAEKTAAAKAFASSYSRCLFETIGRSSQDLDILESKLVDARTIKDLLTLDGIASAQTAQECQWTAEQVSGIRLE